MIDSLASCILWIKDNKAINNDIKNRMGEVVENDYTSEYFTDITQDYFEILYDAASSSSDPR